MCVCIVGVHGKTWGLKWVLLGVQYLSRFYELVGMIHSVVDGL